MQIAHTGIAAAGIAAVAAVSLHAAKPAPPPPPPWTCTITLDESLSYTDPVSHTVQTVPTTIQSDGAGAYEDGVGGVRCYISQDPAGAKYRYLYFTTGTTRYLWMPGQVALTPYSRSSYGSVTIDYFDITDIATVGAATPGTSVTERRRIRTGPVFQLDFNNGHFVGDSLSSDPLVVGSSSAWVTTLTFNAAGAACSWNLRLYPYAATEAGDTGAIAARYLALQETVKGKVKRTADFTMPFSATVRLEAGVNGCS
jgi:hypothetical protein